MGGQEEIAFLLIAPDRQAMLRIREDASVAELCSKISEIVARKFSLKNVETSCRRARDALGSSRAVEIVYEDRAEDASAGEEDASAGEKDASAGEEDASAGEKDVLREEHAEAREEPCRHRRGMMCVRCTPLDPWDDVFLKQRKIKYMSFGSFCRKLGRDRLGTDDYYAECVRVRSGGDCVQMMHQKYRHVDHVEFVGTDVVIDLIDYWRSSKRQRLVYLVGTIEDYGYVPGGRKAVVHAAYVPLQTGYPDGFALCEDITEVMRRHGRVFEKLGLRIVGTAHTSIYTENNRLYSVRKKKDFFISSTEAVFGCVQMLHGLREIGNSVFGTDMVGVVVGSEENCIDTFAYQMTDVALELARENMLTATSDPALVYSEIEFRYKKDSQDTADNLVPAVCFTVALSCGTTLDESRKIFSSQRFEQPRRRHMRLTASRVLARLERGVSLDVFSNFVFLCVFCSEDVVSTEVANEVLLSVKNKDEQRLARIFPQIREIMEIYRDM